jgi:choline/glycine/proline betaine transport protein
MISEHLPEDPKSRHRLLEKLKRAEKTARAKAIKEREKFRGLQIRPTANFFDSGEEKEPGEDNWSGLGFDIHPHVTLSSVFILAVCLTLALMFKEQAGAVTDGMLHWISSTFGWFFILAANIFIGAAIYFAFSRLGHIRIGGKNAQPEFSNFAWYSMLLSAGMGIGLMFWSVGEPMFHYSTPSPMFSGVEPETADAARAAMGVTYFHWGLHPWAIYAIVGLGLAFFAYNRGMPLTIRSIFHPILGNGIHGGWGNLIDVLSVLATLTGLATSLGLGVQQINAGLNYLFGVEVNAMTQVVLIGGITLVATLSVMAGLDGGVKRLSEWNMAMAAVFMLFILIVGPTVYLLGGFTQNLGFYLTHLAELSLWTETFKSSNWQGAWTVFYWAWWMAWSPFVGMFIARISKGRTVREFIIGVMLVPTLLSFLWMSVFGGSALFMESTGEAQLLAAVKDNVATSLFEMLQHFPLAQVLSVAGVLLVTIFFVTSSDSGSLVVDHLTSGGKLDSPVPQRVFWAVMEGVIAGVLLLGGGLTTLQTATIITGLPFALIILLMVYALYLGLREELFVEEAVKRRLQTVIAEHRVSEAVASAQDALEATDKNAPEKPPK